MGVLGGKVGRGMKRSVKRLSVCEENAQELDGSYFPRGKPAGTSPATQSFYFKTGT